MNIRLYNARILTMEPGREVFYGEVWVKNDKIAYVAEQKELAEEWDKSQFPRIAWDIELDCKGNLLMPGFKNAHTHSGMTFLRSMADDLPLDQWLNKQVFPLEAKLTGEDIYELTRLAVLEYLTSGVTSIFDMYLTPDTIAEACLDTGMRCVLVSGLNNFSSSPKQVEKEFLKWNKKNSLISYQLGFHAEYTTSKEHLKQVAALSEKLHAPVYFHNSETALEVEQCKERYGMTPTRLMEELGMFQYGGGGYHCVYFEDEDFEIFRKRNLTAVTNPASNLKLASGIAPIDRFIKEGINLAIGTDGPASNNCLDMFREMFLTTGLAKVREKDAACVGAEEVLYMATTGGAAAMGLNECDSLAEGKKADLIMLDLKQPNMQPENNLVRNIVYSGSKQNVKLTMVNGQILYEDNTFQIGFEPEEIYRKANEIIGRMK